MKIGLQKKFLSDENILEKYIDHLIEAPYIVFKLMIIKLI